MATPYLLGVDIGGTQTRVAIARRPRGAIRRTAFSSPSRSDPSLLIDGIIEAADELISRTPDGEITAGVVACAGTVDTATGTIVESPNLPMVREFAMADALKQRLDIPIEIENDATAAAYAVHQMGAGRGTTEMIYLTISTGIGGGIISGGKLLRGIAGAAGEFGHMTIGLYRGIQCPCGMSGCWETMASGTAIARMARMRMEAGEDSSLVELVRERGHESVTARDVFDAAAQDDALSRAVVDEAGYALGVGLANIVNIMNPELIVLGGGLARGQDEFVKHGISVARERAFKLQNRTVRYEVTELGDDNGLRGALLLARELASRARRAAKRSG